MDRMLALRLGNAHLYLAMTGVVTYAIIEAESVTFSEYPGTS